MHASGGNRTRNFSKQVAADQNLKARGNWIGIRYIVYVKRIKRLNKFMLMFYKTISVEYDGR